LSIEKTIVQKHKDNFETLRRAFENGNVCIVDCIEKGSDEHVAVICAVEKIDNTYFVTPFARFFNGNPYDILTPPIDEANPFKRYP
jgi:hypothetical protein